MLLYIFDVEPRQPLITYLYHLTTGIHSWLCGLAHFSVSSVLLHYKEIGMRKESPLELPGNTLKCFCLKVFFFWTAIEVMTPWTPGGVLCNLLPSSENFGRFGSSHPWMILLWGRKKETTAIRTYRFQSRLHMLSVFWHLSLRTGSNFYINFSHSSSSTWLDSLRSPTCIKDPWKTTADLEYICCQCHDEEIILNNIQSKPKHF